jgi:hypothetical protein
MGKIEEQPILTTNGWEEVEKKGDAGIKKWIDDTCPKLFESAKAGLR